LEELKKNMTEAIQLVLDALDEESKRLSEENRKLQEFIVDTEERHVNEFVETLAGILTEMRKPKPNIPQWATDVQLPERIMELIIDWWKDIPLGEKYSHSKLLSQEIKKMTRQSGKAENSKTEEGNDQNSNNPDP
jgi:hypothetical protein